VAEPTTVNGGLIIPNTGDLPGTWGSAALNPDFVALDGQLYGVQTISASNAPIVLSSPSGFTPTPSGGPTQAQNAVLRFTGSLSANVKVTLPLPGYYIVENLTTNNNFVLSFAAVGSGQVVGIEQGETVHVYNDGTNVKFVNFGRIGHTEIWAGVTALPGWVTACTARPYLLCDGSVYNFSDFPYLGAKLLGQFGGNGITTFGVPDLRGRMPLPYDGTGTRITAGGCGINGQTLGAALDQQTVAITALQVPTITSNGNNTITVTGPTQGTIYGSCNNIVGITGGSGGNTTGVNGANLNSFQFSGTTNIGVTSSNTGGQGHNNVQPSQVTGIAVIRAA
jgi:microcystin-dependent protein